MASILRWFEHDGRRHRAWYRQTEDGARELMVAGPDWQMSLPGDAHAPLDEIPDTHLSDLAQRGSTMSRDDRRDHR